MNKVSSFVKNNKVLILSLIAILVLSSFFREEIRESRETMLSKETQISQLRVQLQESQLKIKQLSEKKEQEVSEVIIINKDGSKKIVKNSKTKSSKNENEMNQKETKITKDEWTKTNKESKITREEKIHGNPKKLDVYVGVDMGFNGELEYFGGFRYNIMGPIKAGVQASPNSVGLTLGMEF